MKQSPFRVIEGGLAATTEPGHRPFAEGWVTNSRLMGVLAMGIRWAHEGKKNSLWQFFYFDCEEYGFDRYEEYDGADPEALLDLELSMIGGLGSSKVSITQKQAVHLFLSFLRYNQRYGIELPGDPSRYLFLQHMDGNLTQEEQEELFRRTCVPITSQVMSANYFMMRCAGKDFAAAQFLTANGEYRDLLPGLPQGTLYRNAVTPGEDGFSCTCESLIDAGGFSLVMTRLYFEGFRILSAEVLSRMPITELEAQMVLGHSEYVSVFSCTAPMEALDRRTTRLTRGAVINEEHDGRTFMIFHKDNRHVEENPYLLFHDLKGLYHIEDNGEILVSASTLSDIHQLELDLMFSHLNGHIQMLQGFQFTEPVLGHYLESTYPTFMEFVEAIQG